MNDSQNINLFDLIGKNNNNTSSEDMSRNASVGRHRSKPIALPDKTCQWPECERTFTPASGRSKYCPGPHRVRCQNPYCGKYFETTAAYPAAAAKYCAECKAEIAKRNLPKTKSKIKTGICAYPGCDKPCSSKKARTCSKEHAQLLGAMKQTTRSKVCAYPGCDKPISSKNARTCSRAHATALRKLTQAKETADPNAHPDKAKICAHPGCGRKFIPVRKSQKYCTAQHHNICGVCGNPFDVNPGSTTKYCSPHCSSIAGHTPESQRKRRENSLKKWGTETPLQSEEVKAKIRKTLDEHPELDHRIGSSNFTGNLQKKYGDDVTNASQLDEVKNKKKTTVQEHYGVENPMQSPIIKAKVAETSMERYGVACALALPENQEKAVTANRKLYGVDRPFQNPKYRQKAIEALVKSRHGGAVSKMNHRFADDLKTMDPDVTVDFEAPIPDNLNADGSKRIMRVDFKLSKANNEVYVDLNPTISHNSALSYGEIRSGDIDHELTVTSDTATPRSYSYDRARRMMEAFPDVDYVQVWDWDNLNTSMVRLDRKITPPSISYSAHNLTIEEIPQSEANKLLKEWHPQGAGRKQTACYSLVDPKTGEPLMVGTFGEPRFNKDHQWEWIRSAIKPGVRIYGGQSKVFKRFRTDHTPESVVSYIDFSKTTTAMTFLNHCGFSEVKPTGPALVWSKGDESVPETSLLRLGADRLLGTSYGSREESGLYNHGIMLIEGWLPVWTAGNRVFTWTAGSDANNRTLPAM